MSDTFAGTAASAGPCTFDTHELNAGHTPLFAGVRGRPVMHWYASWSPELPTSERMMANLSIILAMRGNSSQIWIPGTLVWIGLNSPRTSAGASGLRSHMSMCGGPPGR